MDTSSADYKRYQAWLAANPPPPAPGPPPKTIDQCLVEFQKCDRPHRIPAAHAPAPAPSSVLPAPAPAPMTSNYATNPGKDCYNASYDLGYQGVKSQAAIQALCDANPKCTGAVQHSGGDWWLLSQVNAPPTNSPGSMCIMKPGIGMPVLSAPPVSSVTQAVATPGQSGLINISGYQYQSYLRTDYDYPSSAMQYLTNKTLTQCAQACATTSGCKGFATGAAVSPTVAGDCSLKNAWTPSGLQPNTNLNAYQYLGASGTSGYAIEGSYLGGLVSSKRDWTLIMILFVLAVLLWIIAKKM